MRAFRLVGVEVNVRKERQNIHKNKSHSVLSLLCDFLVNRGRKREWEEGREKIFRTQSKSNPTPPGNISCLRHLFLLALGGNLSRHCPLRTVQYLQLKGQCVCKYVCAEKGKEEKITVIVTRRTDFYFLDLRVHTEPRKRFHFVEELVICRALITWSTSSSSL